MQSTTPRPELRRLLAVLLPAAVAALALGSCGGSDDEADVEALLDRAFRQPVNSADVRIDAELELKGLKGFDRPLRVQAEGPFVGGKGTLPKLDIDIRIGPAGTGQSVQSGILSTGDRAFVKFGGEFYEQERSDVASANRELGRDRNGRRGSLRELGLNPRAWVVDAKMEGNEKVAGAEVRHVSGRLNVRRMFTDFNKVVKRSTSAVGGTSPDVPNPLDAAQLDQLSEIVEDPTFDVYVGKDDVIRRVSAKIGISVPERDRAKANGIESGELRFSVELRKVNGDQTITPPAKARPVSDLTKQIGGASALQGLSGAGQAGGRGSDSSGGGAGGSAPPAGAFKRYGDCLDKTRPDDVKALSECAEILR